jgi:hypothetical protein
MKSLSITWPLLAVLVAATANFVACGGESQEGGAANGASSGNGGTNAAGGGASSGGSSNTGGTASNPTCPSAECGPALGLPSTTCADGSIAGPTGLCLRLATGACGWEVRACPTSVDGGGAGVGGASASGGTAAAGAGAGEGGANFSDRCGGCDDTGPAPQICIYQAGGPGPGGFVCATQNPCRAAGACACIVNQGTCSSMLEGGSPGYCVCDNGRD